MLLGLWCDKDVDLSLNQAAYDLEGEKKAKN